MDRNRRDHAIAWDVDTNNATDFGNSTRFDINIAAFKGLQSQDRQDTWPDHPAIAARDRRRSDRITPAMSGVGTFQRLAALHLVSVVGH